LFALFLLSFIRFVDVPDYWIIDFSSNFPFQYGILSAIFTVILLWKKKIPFAVAAGILCVFNMIALVDLGNTAHAVGHEHDSATFKVYSTNINKANKNITKLVSGLTESNADILLLLEVTDRNIKSLQQLIQTYPYRIINLNVGSEGTGTVLLSKFPILTHEVTKYSEFGNMLVSALLEITNKKVIFYGTHFPKPMSIQEYPARLKQFMSLAHKINGKSFPIIVAGDFNATPYSPLFKRFLEVSGLKDSRKGFGWLPSWPSYLPFCWLPIDHILVSSDIHVKKRSNGSYIGSDHFPVLAELSLS
jgi:endonuclease/exonuclease/phosphatase (EEP) superfamily protein YafD